MYWVLRKNGISKRPFEMSGNALEWEDFIGFDYSYKTGIQVVGRHLFFDEILHLMENSE